MMVLWEIRKSISTALILSAAVLCGVWYWICGSFFVGSYEGINGDIYRSYIRDLSVLSRDEQLQYISEESAAIELALSSYDKNNLKYLHGEISEEEYLEYMDAYNASCAKSATFALVEKKFERISETPGLSFTYDLELEGYLTAMTADFPLILLLAIAGCGIFISDIPTEAFVKTCKNGRERTFASKLLAMLAIGAALVAAFNFAELAALFSKDLGDLSAPAASMDHFAALDIDISCIELIAATFLLRIAAEFAICVIFFSLSSLCKNAITYFGTVAALVVIPAFFVNILPPALRGIVVYYPLKGVTVLLEGNVPNALLCLALLAVASFGSAWRYRRF